MARVLIDDLTEELIRTDADGGTVKLTLDGDSYELDLSTASQDTLRELLAPYFAVARHTPKPGTSRQAAIERAPSASGDEPSDAEVRTWARDNNIEVGAIGRVKKSVRDAYLAAVAERAGDPQPADQPAPAPGPPAPPPSPAQPSARPRPEQVEMAEDLLARDVPAHLIVDQTGMTIEQVRELRRELERR